MAGGGGHGPSPLEDVQGAFTRRRAMAPLAIRPALDFAELVELQGRWWRLSLAPRAPLACPAPISAPLRATGNLSGRHRISQGLPHPPLTSLNFSGPSLASRSFSGPLRPSHNLRGPLKAYHSVSRPLHQSLRDISQTLLASAEGAQAPAGLLEVRCYSAALALLYAATLDAATLGLAELRAVLPWPTAAASVRPDCLLLGGRGNSGWQLLAAQGRLPHSVGNPKQAPADDHAQLRPSAFNQA